IPAIFQANGVISQVLKNAAASRIYGAEVSGSWNITDEFGLDFGGTYLNAHYTNFPDGANDVPIGGNVGNIVVSQDLSGFTMEGSPTFSGNLTGRFSKDTSVGH